MSEYGWMDGEIFMDIDKFMLNKHNIIITIEKKVLIFF